MHQPIDYERCARQPFADHIAVAQQVIDTHAPVVSVQPSFVIQEIGMIVGYRLCGLVEQALFGDGRD